MPYFKCENIGGGSDGPRYITRIDGEIQNRDIKLITDGEWTSVSTLPYEFQQSSPVVLNNKIHILGGGNGNSTKHYKYDGSTWTSVSTLPYQFFNSSPVVLNNEIHILGSWESKYRTNHYKYDGSTWTSVSSLQSEFYHS